MVCGYVSIGCIIVPTAGRLATFTSLTPMNGDRVRIECILQDDARLLEGIPVIVSHAADYAGIPEKVRTELATETLNACRKALALIAERKQSDRAIWLLVDQFQDRVEITIEHEGEDIPDSRDKADRRGASRVPHETGDGRSRMKFVRYCDALDSKQAE
jgi:hypothetical protein